jgi:hypothetical protein
MGSWRRLRYFDPSKQIAPLATRIPLKSGNTWHYDSQLRQCTVKLLKIGDMRRGACDFCRPQIQTCLLSR